MKKLKPTKSQKNNPEKKAIIFTIIFTIIAIYYCISTFTEITEDDAYKKVSKNISLYTESGDEVKLEDVPKYETVSIVSKDSNTFIIEAVGYIFDIKINGETPQLENEISTTGCLPTETKWWIIPVDKGDTISITPIDTYKISYIKQVILGNTETAIKAAMNPSLYINYGFLILCALGVFEIVMFIAFYRLKFVEVTSLFYGVAIVFISTALSMDSGVWQFFDAQMALPCAGTSCIAFSIAIFILSYMNYSLKKSKTPEEHSLLKTLVIINFVNIILYPFLSSIINTANVILMTLTIALHIFYFYKRNKVIRYFFSILTLIVGYCISIANNRFINRTIIPILFAIITIFTVVGTIIYILKKAQAFAKKEQIVEMKKKDSLTGLLNKDCYISKIEELKESGTVEIGIALFDINDLKLINNNFGYQEGDNAIKKFSGFLRKSFDKSSFIYRINGDEFTVILTGINIGSRFEDAIMKFQNQCIEYNKKAPKGLAISVAHGTKIGNIFDYKILHDKAYKRLCERKSHMKSEDFVMDNTIYKILKNAILYDSIVPYFQPIRDNTTGEFNKFEALMRINFDNKTYSPGQFMNDMKHSERYLDISAQMIQKVFDAFREINATVSINISMKDIECNRIRNMIFDNLSRPHKNKIILELLETEEFTEFDKLFEFIDKVKEMGSLIAIDDFGSGYASLTLISKIKPDIIKIDGEIIKNITTDPTMKSIITSVTKIAESIDAEVVAEYIENEEIQNIIEKNHIRYSQGYYYSKPLPIGELNEFLPKD